jgi:hypothetical protein
VDRFLRAGSDGANRKDLLVCLFRLAGIATGYPRHYGSRVAFVGECARIDYRDTESHPYFVDIVAA